MLHQMKPHWVLLTTVWVISLTARSDCKTVVMIPNPATSHTLMHTYVAREMSKLGHRTWVTMPTYISDKGYIDTSDFEIIPYETLPGLEERALKIFTGKYFEGEEQSLFEFVEFSKEIYHTLLTNETFLEAIGAKKPDLIVIDYVATMYPITIIPYRLGTPFAFLGDGYDLIGSRIPYSMVETPITFLPYGNKMTFSQKLQTVLVYSIFSLFNVVSPSNAVALYAPEMPYIPLDMLVARAEIWLVEKDHIIDYPRPTLPNVKFLGSMVTGPAKPLLPRFKSFMDGATQGVVVVSFGSADFTFPEHLSDKLFDVFRQLPMKVVVRSNLTSPDPSKIMTSTWMPQNDLLGHPNTKVFVSHCGSNGQYEALYHMVPSVAVPLFGEGVYNAERFRSKGFAELLDIKTCTVDDFVKTVLKVAREPQYREKLSIYSRLFKQQFGVPVERASFWLDHVMEYGGDYMRSAGQEMPYYQFTMVDVISFVFFVLVAFVFLLSGCVYMLCRNRRKKVKSD